jgi:hypothetical protein
MTTTFYPKSNARSYLLEAIWVLIIDVSMTESPTSGRVLFTKHTWRHYYSSYSSIIQLSKRHYEATIHRGNTEFALLFTTLLASGTHPYSMQIHEARSTVVEYKDNSRITSKTEHICFKNENLVDACLPGEFLKKTNLSSFQSFPRFENSTPDLYSFTFLCIKLQETWLHTNSLLLA